MAVNTAQLNTRVASSLLSETTDAGESAEPVAAASEAGEAASEEPTEPEYDASIYVGNISFGKSGIALSTRAAIPAASRLHAQLLT